MTHTPQTTPRTALVTGASRGLGAAIAMELAQAGCRVAVNYAHSKDLAERVASQIRASGGEAILCQADVREASQIDAMVTQIEETFGGVDILVANATGPQPLLSIDQQTWQSFLDQLEFFVKSPLLLLQRVLPGMRQRGFGRIIQIGSEVFELGNPRFANYVAAKGAQLGQTRSWARELGPTGITVNLVAPGWIPVERHAEAPKAELAEYTRGVPLGYQGKPHDVAAMVAFLASDQAAFITGQKLSVNGGNTLL
jgi:3-oxoacyl-[acyl-carrier protein] reductase